MITGDNPLTACHVARELHFTKKPVTLILTNLESTLWGWESVDGKIQLPIEDAVEKTNIWEQYALCITGEVYILFKYFLIILQLSELSILMILFS